MSENVNPNIPADLAKDMEEVNKHNAGYVDDPEPAPEGEGKPEDQPKPDKGEEDPKEVDKSGETPPTDQEDEESDDEKAPESKPDESPEEPKGPTDEEEGTDEDEDDKGEDPVGSKETKRPIKYIPIPKYKSEKEEWQKTLKAKDEEIARLSKEAELSKGQKEDLKTAETAEDLEVFIKENQLDDDSAKIVRGLATFLEKRTASKIPDMSVLQRAQQQEQQRKEQEFFDKEFNETKTLIKKHFPDITPEQEAIVKKRLDALAHTKELHKTPLRYILAGDVEEIGKLIGKDGEPESEADAPKGRKTALSSRPGKGKHVQLDAKFFKDKDDFKELDSLDPASKKEIIGTFDPDTYVRFVNWEGQKDDTGLEVNRGGRKITLK